MTNNERTMLIHDKSMWQANKELDAEGQVTAPTYFDSYSVVSLKGKKAIVLCESGGYICNVVSDWYDDIKMFAWSGDYRWNHDRPCICIKDGLCNMLSVHDAKEMLPIWLKTIEEKWGYNKVNGTFTEGCDDEGNEYIISLSGHMTQKRLADPQLLRELLLMVKEYTIEQIKSKWINKNKPCMYIRGLEYKGAKKTYIQTYKAKELIKTHQVLHGKFNNLEFCISDNQVVLVFRDYADSDYD